MIIDELLRTLQLRVEDYPIVNSKHHRLYMLMVDINSNRHRVQLDDIETFSRKFCFKSFFQCLVYLIGTCLPGY